MDVLDSRRTPANFRPAPDGLDFTAAMRRLCEDLTRRREELAHIDMQRVVVAWTQVRKAVGWGVQATLTPLRFERGARETVHRGRRYTIQSVRDQSGREMLYILRFYLPRFLNLPHAEKLSTVVHELWHISPAFDGDLRRHEGRCHVHSRRASDFHAHARQLAEAWLDSGPDPALHDFLQLDFAGLQQRFGRIYGQRIAQPRLVPVA